MLMNHTCLLTVFLAVGLWGLAGGCAKGAAIPPQTSAKDWMKAPVLSASTSWTGNSFGGGGKGWVQDFICAMAVGTDGKCYTISFWDEAHQEAGMYAEGRVLGNLSGAAGDAVACNAKYVFASKATGFGRYTLAGKSSGPLVKLPNPPTAMGASDATLAVTDSVAGTIALYDPETLARTGEWKVKGPGAAAVGPDGDIWVASGLTRQTTDGHYWMADKGNPPKVQRYTPQGRLLMELRGPGGWLPTCLAFDARGRLMVGDNGWHKQIHFYDLSGEKPRLESSFGALGGIGSGTPGEVKPDKLWGITGVGTDASGTLYVSMSEQGALIRAFSPASGTGWSLKWEVMCLNFVDMTDADPQSDAVDVYGKQEHYVMDYSLPAGEQWQFKGYTLDAVKYPEDARLWLTNKDHHITTPFMRRLSNGKLYMYTTGMYAGHIAVYRMDGELARPSGLIAKENWLSDATPDWPPHQPDFGGWIWRDKNGDGRFDKAEYEEDPESHSLSGGWGMSVDSRGDIWLGMDDGSIKHLPLKGFDAKENPIYSYGSVNVDMAPEPFNNIRRVEYVAETDTMYLSGNTEDDPYDGNFWKEAGKFLARYDNWSKGNRKASYIVRTPWDADSEPKLATISLSIAGDYVFMGGCGESRARVWVFEAKSGEAIGQIMPGPEVGGLSKTGWIDVPYGVIARKRANGEYVIFVEEDFHSKVLLYRWRP